MGACARLGVAIAALVCLAGCAPNDGAPTSATALAPAPLVKRAGVSLAAATVALVSLDGAPDATAQDFREALTRQFAARDIAAVDANKARYLLRGYLSASPTEGGARLEYVFDVFDRRRVRLMRLNDAVAAQGSGDAWSQMSGAMLDAAAEKCADDVAAFLSNAPEAKPAPISTD
jgi:hypothetical protein